MKRSLLFFLLVFFMSFTASSQFKFGAGVETNFDQFGVKAAAHFTINEEWAGQVSAAYFLDSPNASMFNFDAHYELVTIGDNEEIQLNGLGGFNYYSTGISGAGGELGMNLGLNINFQLTESLEAFIEPKITFISVGDFWLTAGVYF